MLMWEFGHTTGWKTTWFSFSFEWEFHPLLTQFFSWPPCSSIPFPKVEENTLPAQRSLRDDDEKIPQTVKCTLQATALVYYFCIFSIFFQYFLRLFFLLFLGSQWLKTTLKSLILQHCNLRNLVEKRVRNTNCIRMCELYSVKYDILARKFIYIL